MSIILNDSILLSVEKPSRYTGGEWNSVNKKGAVRDKSGNEPLIRFAFCFPDTYEIGMSHLGMKILYHLLNERGDTWCERVFAPWTDMEQKMRAAGIPLFALESRDPVSEFDFVGFTLQYEMSYTNIINMLDLAGIPILSADRADSHPFVCAGGPCAYNPEPLADIIDFYVIGEGEEIIGEVMDAYLEWKRSGDTVRAGFLDRIASIQGIYVPSFYEAAYNQDGTLASIIPVSGKYPVSVKKRIIDDLDSVYFPEKIIVPFTSIVHDRIMLELFRGCSRGCRFCQAGFVYRPVRERSPGKLAGAAKALVANTGYEEISLTSLSTSDYSGLQELTDILVDEMGPKKVNLSLPSLRIDSFSLELMEKAQKVRRSGLTFAPEAGTQQLRNIINKGVTEKDLADSVAMAFRGGWDSVKLYFMIGLPGETYDDIEGIAKLAFMIREIYRRVQAEADEGAASAVAGKRKFRPVSINISTSSFVPKPFTPFQWEAQDEADVLREKQKFLAGKLKSRGINYSWHDPELSFLEAVISRGDRKVGKVIIRAWEKGCRFDGWGEHFRYDLWMQAFSECGTDPHFYANRKRHSSEVFPWSHIDTGVNEEYLLGENEKAMRREVTPDCRDGCHNCGAAVFGGGICFGRHQDKV